MQKGSEADRLAGVNDVALEFRDVRGSACQPRKSVELAKPFNGIEPKGYWFDYTDIAAERERWQDEIDKWIADSRYWQQCFITEGIKHNETAAHLIHTQARIAELEKIYDIVVCCDAPCSHQVQEVIFGKKEARNGNK